MKFERVQLSRYRVRDGTLPSVRTLFALVHAPGLGPASWRPTGDRLAAAGHEVVIPDLTGFTDAGPPYAGRLIGLASAQLPARRAGQAVLVVHSGAGAFAPYLAAEISDLSPDVIFADATVPPQSGENKIVGSEGLAFLGELARDGIVPPWPQWWSDEILATLFPDPQTQRVVSGEATSLPLDFYAETLPAMPSSWSARKPAYLCFSDSYRSQAEQARQRGWPVRYMRGEHLHMLVDPAGVSVALTEIAAELAQVARGG